MSDMAVAADGYAHARFVAEFFEGPIDGYSAASSDNGVATAGVSPPDMLIVAPASNGTASITVTAFGPGGAATHTFVARVGAGSVSVDRPSAPAPVAPAPAESEVFVPADELLPISDSDEPATTDAEPAVDIPFESLPAVEIADAPAEITEAPSLSGSVPEQIVSEGRTTTVDLNPYFVGVVQGWAVQTSNPTSVEVSMTVAGQVTITALAEGISTVSVTAENDRGRVAQAFRVAVRRGSEADQEQTQTTEAVIGAPDFTVGMGRVINVDLSALFSVEATGFSVSYDAAGSGGRVDVTVRGSEATIRGVQAGKIAITIVATGQSQRVIQLATVEVTPL